MQPGHDAAKGKQHVPKWVPVVLLGISTVALSVPIILLRRQRAAAQVLTKAPPPRRRGGPPLTPRATSAAVPVAPRVEQIHVPRASKGGAPADTGFDISLYSIKAFGIASTLVAIGTYVGIWAVQTGLGVQNTEEFAMRMREILTGKMPILSSRLRRQSEDKNDGEEVEMPPGGGIDAVRELGATEGRLNAGYMKNGYSGWIEAALEELEAEVERERLRKEGLVKDSSDSS